MGRSGRRKPGEPTVFEEYLHTVRHPALRKIAEAAGQRGFSVRQLARLAGRDEASIRRTFDADRTPQRTTIDAFARAVGIDPLRLHAELDDLGDGQRGQILGEVIRRIRFSDAFSVAPGVAAEQFMHAFRASEALAQNAAARAFVLARVEAPALTDDLLAAALSEIDGRDDGTAGTTELGRPSLADLSGTTALKGFAEALGDRGVPLLSLFREWQPGTEALWLIAQMFSLHLGFSDDEIRRCMAPTIALLRKRNYAKLCEMLAYARTQYKPLFLEERKNVSL
jgi:Helix-turn-helix domain